MTIKQAKEKGFTNEGKMYGIPVYFSFDNEECVVAGKNRIADLLVNSIAYLDSFFGLSNGFEISDKGRL